MSRVTFRLLFSWRYKTIRKLTTSNLVGAGIQIGNTSVCSYIVDAYPQYAASGLAAFAVLRCTVAAFLPLAGPQMYDSLGVGWGSSLLGFIAVALIPIPTLIYKYGKWMRERFPLVL